MSTFSTLFAGGGLQFIALDTFTASGTWTKPAATLPTDLIVVDMWDGGGSGAVGQSAAPGGAGGNFNRFEFLAGKLSATEAVVIGAGGAVVAASVTVPGLAGGLSTFKGFGSKQAPGVAVAAAVPGAAPVAGICISQDMADRGGLCATSLVAVTSPPTSFFAGAQGGNIDAGAVRTPSVSLAGGNGGTAVSAGSAVAVAGVAPGGGGGAASGGSGTRTSGAGARGEVRVYVIRGALTVNGAILPTSI